MDMNIEDVVDKYIQLRDKKAAIKAKAKEKTERIDGVLDKLEAALLTTFDELGMESAKTALGTAYKSTQVSATVADRESFLDFVIDKGAYELLDARVSKAAVEEYKKANAGLLPPGINYHAEIVINVRRS